MGKRIFVLTPQGETLQVFYMPEGARGVVGMAVVGRELIVRSYGVRMNEAQYFALLGA